MLKSIIASPKHADQRSGSFKYHDNVHWLRPAAGMAMAASVAALAILLFPKYSDIASDGPGVQVASAPSTVIYTTSTGTRWKNLAEPTVESRLNRYLEDHSEYASPGGMSGVLPYASFVSYDAGQ